MSTPTEGERGPRAQWLLPLAVFAVLTAGGLGAWWSHQRAHHERLALETEVVAEQVRYRLETWIETRITLIGHFADHWNESYASAPETYRAPALTLIESIPGIQAINWVDRDGVIRMVTPAEPNRGALGQDLHQHPAPDVRRAIEEAHRERRVTRTSCSIDFLQGGRGFAVYWPVVGANGELDGFVNGVFRGRQLIDLCLPEPVLRERFRLSLAELDGTIAYRVPPEADDAVAWAKAVDQELRVVDRPWRLTLAPAPDHITSIAHASNWFILAGGVALAAIFAMLVRRLLVRQAQLRASNEQIRLLMDSTAEGIFGLDLEGNCTFCNRACLELLGYEDPAELLGQHMHTLVHHSRPDGTPLPDEQCMMQSAFRRGAAVYADSECLWRRDGTHFGAEYRSHPILESNVVRGAVVTFADVSGRREVEQSQQRLLAILEATPDMVAITDHDLRIVYLNSTGRSMLGLEKEDPLGLLPFEFHPESEHERIENEVFPQAREKGMWEGELTVLSRTKERTEVSMVVLAHRNPEGQIEFFSTIARDITARKAAEAGRAMLETQFQHAQKLESLGLLAGGIAHDFNNLLVGVLGNASLVLSDLPADSPLLPRVSAIATSAERAAELTRQLLTYAGKGPMLAEAVDLSALVREMVELLEVSISKKIHLHLELEPELPAVEGDASQLRQVVMNLITNASDALGAERGVISVRVGTAEIEPADVEDVAPGGELAEGRYCFVEVADTGGGMDEATRRRVFDPFFTTKTAGRGLGLSAVLGIVSGHGGALQLHTAPGSGSTFRIYLPVSVQAPVAAPQPVLAGPEPESSACPASVVLVIDDERAVRELAKNALEYEGFEVVLARSGEEGVSVLREQVARIDAVLLDMTMPGMDGHETLAALHRVRADLPVILSSGHEPGHTLEGLDESGFAAFLQKPFRVGALIAVVQSVLPRKRAS